MLSKNIFCFFLILFLTICCQNTNTIISNEKTDSSIATINNYYNLSKDKSKDSIQRLNHITKAHHLADRLQNDTLILKTLKVKTRLHNENEQPDSAIYFSYEMLRLSEKLQNIPSIGQSCYKLGIYYSEKNEIDSSLQYYNRAQKIFLSLDDRARIGRTFLNMAIIQSDNGDYFGSYEAAIEGLKYLKSSKNDTDIASIYNCLAISSKKQENYEEALSWYDSAMSISSNEKNKITYLNNIANVFRDQEKYEDAISIYDSIINDPLIENDLKIKARILDNLTYSKWLMMGRNTNDLESSFIRALDMRIEDGDLQGQIASNAHLSEYFTRPDLKKSIQYATAMYNVSTRLNSIDDRLEALENLVNLENDFRKVKKHFNHYVDLNDSITEIRVRNKSSIAKIMMENSNLEAQKAQDQLKIEKLNKRNTIYFFVVLLFLMAFVFIYYLKNAKHKRDKLQKIYETEVRLSKKIHDELANDVSDVMNFVDNILKAPKEIKTPLLNTLEDIYLRTRDISTETASIDFVNFSQSLKHLLMQHNSNGVRVITNPITEINWLLVPDHKKMVIYRCLQELMVNMKKHSKATKVIIAFRNNGKKNEIRYTDNGKGSSYNDI